MPRTVAGDNGSGSPTLWVDGPSTPRAADDGPNLVTYLRVLSRRKWLIVVSAIVVSILFFVASSLQTERFQASTQLIYESAVDVANPLGDTYVDPTSAPLSCRVCPPSCRVPRSRIGRRP